MFFVFTNGYQTDIIHFLVKNSNIDMNLSFSKFSRFVVLIGLSLTPIAKAKIDLPKLAETLPVGTSVSVIAKNLTTNKIIIDHQSQTFMLPASTQKVLTALAAKLILPEYFKFQTALLAKGKIENGTLYGNLIAKFTGDPTLSRQQLAQLVATLKKQNIHRISGDLVIDTSVFTSHDKAAGWVWNDLPICFSAQASAVNIDHNCFYVNLNANQPAGSLLRVEIPTAYPVQVSSSAYVAEKSQAAHCLLDAVVYDNNHYHLKGCLARQEKPFGLSFAVQDPTAYGADILKAQLKRAGISFSGKVQFTEQAQQGRLLAEHYSAPLPALLKKMLKKSDNQIADSLFRTLANYHHHRPASFPLAAYTLRTQLKSRAKIDLANSTISDGSGLSRHNQINAQTMLKVLEFIAQNETTLKLTEAFPIAGVDGTLSGRGSMTKEPLAKNITAKTGALKGVHNLAGFMTNARGEKIAFVQFINGYSTSPDPERKANRTALNQFEHRLFMEMYNE